MSHRDARYRFQDISPSRSGHFETNMFCQNLHSDTDFCDGQPNELYQVLLDVNSIIRRKHLTEYQLFFRILSPLKTAIFLKDVGCLI